MKIKPNYEVKYLKEYLNIWPEVEEGVFCFGIKNYSIFIKALTLFLISKLKILTNL